MYLLFSCFLLFAIFSSLHESLPLLSGTEDKDNSDAMATIYFTAMYGEEEGGASSSSSSHQNPNWNNILTHSPTTINRILYNDFHPGFLSFGSDYTASETRELVTSESATTTETKPSQAGWRRRFMFRIPKKEAKSKENPFKAREEPRHHSAAPPTVLRKRSLMKNQ
jgi:hypothetical protein